MTIYDLLRNTKPKQIRYINVETWELFDMRKFDREYYQKHPDALNHFGVLPDDVDLPVFELPRYEEINHKKIMRFYVKKFVYEPEYRKALFDILKRYEYMDAFYKKIKEFGLYEDYCNATDSLYNDILHDWAVENNIDLSKNLDKYGEVSKKL